MTTPILLPTDNPHELLDIICTDCRKRLIDSREEAAKQGWGAVFSMFTENGKRFYEYFCPDCFVDSEAD